MAGRPKGTPNKSTQERILRMAQEESAALKTQGAKKLGKDVLEEMTLLCQGLAGYYQQKIMAGGVMPSGTIVSTDEERFYKCVELTRDFAVALTKYQSPTFKAQFMMNTPPGSAPRGPITDPKVIDLTDAAALERVYRLRIGQVQG